MENEEIIYNGVIVSVAIEKSLYSFDMLFNYLAAFETENEVCAGKRVLIPFGRGTAKHIGMIFNVRNNEYKPGKIKKIYRVLDEKPVLNDEMLKMATWLKETTFCTYYDAIRTILPAGMNLKINNNGDGNSENIKTKTGSETLRMVRLIENEDDSLFSEEYTPKQNAVIKLLEECGAASVKEACYACNVTSAVVATLIKKGRLEEFSTSVSRSVTVNRTATGNPSDIKLSPKQEEIFNSLKGLLKSEKANCALLRGVTGSGKTSVFIKLIEYAIKIEKTAILLIPEISLTPQTMENFIALFGNDVAIIHSNLSLGQRLDEYKRIENGGVKIVIGTRSAIFAPLSNIGIIIIDEEGEHTYKSERSPRYHAREAAKQRAFYHKALLLLASATPSLESYHFAKTGRYSLFELEERYSKALLPDVYLVDMKIEAENGNRTNFSEMLLHEINSNLEKGEQTIILLNRRGYHTYANCIACGAVIECPNCALSLTYHKANESVSCHYCGFMKPMPEKCGKCGSRFIHQSGTGTQRIEDELGEYFPKARILRMDADTTISKTAFETKFKQFGNKEFDIMVGTQMIAKGLDFENVTLVGVLLIDKALYSGDYLGYEKTFSLVTQVVGRSGRGSKKGRAYIQTFTPDHYVLELAAAQDYVKFYEEETEIRKALIFPPFCDVFMICFSSADEKASLNAAAEFLKIIKPLLENAEGLPPYRVLGPTKSGAGRKNGKYKHKLIIKSKNNNVFRKVLDEAQKKAFGQKAFKDIGFYIDINGDIE